VLEAARRSFYGTRPHLKRTEQLRKKKIARELRESPRISKKRPLNGENKDKMGCCRVAVRDAISHSIRLIGVIRGQQYFLFGCSE